MNRKLPANIIGPRVSSNYFTVSKQAGRCTLVSEISDLPSHVLCQPLYNDAADEGFVVVSAMTLAEMPFALERCEHDREGDLVALHYKAVGRDDLDITIFND